MADFQDLDEFFDGSLRLPIGGKWYRIPSPDGETGLKIQRYTEIATKAAKAAREGKGGEAELDKQLLTDQEELDLYPLALGPAFEEMRADGVAWSRIRHAAMTAVVWISFGEDPAAEFWASPGKPKPEPNRAQRRATAAANKTRSQASTSGTSTPPATNSA